MASRGRGCRGNMRRPNNIQGHPRPLYKKVLSETTYRILMRERNVKVVLGPEGKHIKEMKSHCNDDCKITIYTQSADGEPFPIDSPDRIINIDATIEDLEIILTHLIPHLQIAPPDKMVQKYNEIRLVVPEFVCSMIIGRKGENVKNIQKDLKSFVQVHRDPLPYSTEYVVSLTNRDVGALAVSAIRVFDSIKSIKCISHVTMFNPVVWYPGEYGDTGSYIERYENKRASHTNDRQHDYYEESVDKGGSYQMDMYRNNHRYNDYDRGYDGRNKMHYSGYKHGGGGGSGGRNARNYEHRAQSYNRGRQHDNRQYPSDHHENQNYRWHGPREYRDSHSHRSTRQYREHETEQEDRDVYHGKGGNKSERGGCRSCGSQEPSYPTPSRRPAANGLKNRGYESGRNA